MTSLSLCLLGKFQATLTGCNQATFETIKSQALLAYLAIHAEKPYRREFLAHLLWPSADSKSGLQSLRQTLRRLRKALPDKDGQPPYLLVSRQEIQFNPNCDYNLDTELFEAHLQAYQHPSSHLQKGLRWRIHQLTAAIELYKGEFLPGFLIESPPFEEWIHVYREKLHRQALDTSKQLCELLLESGRFEQTKQYAWKAIGWEPWRETAHHHLMLALCAQGERTAAIEQYKRYEAILHEELQIEPSSQMEELLTSMIENSPALSQQLPKRRSANKSKLPVRSTPLIGRKTESAMLTKLFHDVQYPWISLIGEGGMGKTHLALSLAWEFEKDFPDGVVFVSLAHLNGTGKPELIEERIASAIAEAFSLSLNPNQPAKAQLLSYLQHKELLLVLDNFEELMEGTGLVLELIEKATTCMLLITSRERLHCRQEYTFRLKGLKSPQKASLQEAQEAESVQLFVERAQAASGDFQINEENVDDILQICHSLDGMPLGILWAAAKTEEYTCAMIAAQIQRSSALLSTKMRDVPNRHRSLQAVFDYSFASLKEREQFAFLSCALFQGSFSSEACQTVTGEPKDVFQRLVHKSLLQQSEEGRFSLHPLARQFLQDKLETFTLKQSYQPSFSWTPYHHAYYRHYLQQLQEAQPAFMGPEVFTQLATLQPDTPNIRQAWEWATQYCDIDILNATIWPLMQYFDLSAQWKEGNHLLTKTLMAIEPLAKGNTSDDIETLLMRVQSVQLMFATVTENNKAALEKAEALLQKADAKGATDIQACLCGILGDGYLRSDNPTRAFELLERGLALGQARNDPYWQLYCLPGLAFFCVRQGEPKRAWEYGKERLAVCETHQIELFTGPAYDGLATAMYYMGDFETAYEYYEKALQRSIQYNSIGHQASTSINMAKIDADFGRYDKALKRLETANHINEQLGRELSLANGLAQVGLTRNAMGDYAQATKALAQSMDIFTQRNASKAIAYVLSYHAGSSLHLAQPQHALAQAKESLALASSINERMCIILSHTYIGFACLALERYDDATTAFSEALALRRTMENQTLAAEPLAGLSAIARINHDTKLMMTHTEEILGYLKNNALGGFYEPMLVYWLTYQSLQSAEDKRSHKFIETANQIIQQRANNIQHQKQRQAYLAIDVHQQLIDAYNTHHT